MVCCLASLVLYFRRKVRILSLNIPEPTYIGCDSLLNGFEHHRVTRSDKSKYLLALLTCIFLLLYLGSLLCISSFGVFLLLKTFFRWRKAFWSRGYICFGTAFPHNVYNQLPLHVSFEYCLGWANCEKSWPNSRVSNSRFSQKRSSLTWC